MEAADVEWELEEGIPQVDDPFIQQYLKGRNSLIEEEQKQRHDFTLRKSLSPLAKTACKIVSKIRDRELKPTEPTLSNHDNRHVSEEALHPGHGLHNARDRMETSELWKILQKMPKGSFLHAHLNVMFDADFLVDQALATEGIHIVAPEALSSQSRLEETPFTLQYLSGAVSSSGNESALWTSSGHSFPVRVSLQSAASSFPNGGEQGFRDWLKSRCVPLRERSGYTHDNYGPAAVWDAYRRSTSVISSLLGYEPILRAGLRRLFAKLADDGVKYAELRTEFSYPFYKKGSGEPEEGFAEWCGVFQEELGRFKNTEEGKSFHGARVIWTTTGISSKQDLAESMMNCIMAKQDFPDVICGFDWVGQEGSKGQLVDFVPMMFWFRKLCVEERVDIPFFFHASECATHGESPSHNLFDAILLGARRIGDGVSLYEHPMLIELIKEKKILVERCPISNGRHRLTDSIGANSLPFLLSRGVPVSLGSDSQAVLGHGWNGLTPELWRALRGPERLEITDLAILIENSIRWSNYVDQPAAEWLSGIREGVLGEGVKAARLQEWYADFEKFCEWIALEYAEVDLDD
ncbi:putative CECR1 family adenosine deaminase [Aspergillus steynii IBT 23096]|uniref:adenosine deaminase n=1 Tax=Aspergillus steynii IBT 23096 TaxID=1392250 RepID=A0A2I2GBA1_9EURO|nr:putative CECR1 family adenosine deaminase [Aspergillus steynii IBT 23096]PLB50154.1 putative CECR1 family adenosine deaminase [Aspergillus steynii IBT 23096]